MRSTTDTGSRVGCDRATLVTHGSYELIATLVHRLDEHRLVSPITQDLADSENVLLDKFRVYLGLGPHRVEDLLLGNDPIRVPDQVAQQIERLRAERYALLPTLQAVIDGVESK